ncbi:MAG: carbohydrate ABC transporter permease [Spirochaetes bacterium]|nr:MAG: carbohydrate ABC transporter permease [Spirochaetota bacterium]
MAIKTGKNKISSAIVLFIYFLIVLFPIYWMFITGIKTPDEIYTPQPTYFPKHPTTANFVSIFTTRPYIRYTINSLTIALGATFTCIVFGTLAAYGFSRYRFKGNRSLRFLFLASRIFPPISLIVPFFIVIGWLHLYNTLLAQIIINTYMWLPFYVWINIGFFDSIPHELEQAAQIDGCSRFQTFFKIAFPLSLPGIAATSIITFLGTWNEFLYNLILAPTERAKNLSVGASDFIADMFISWNQMGAGALITCIPAIIFVIFFQKYIVQGLTAGAVKG